MTKSKFIEKYAAYNGITVTEAEKYVNSFINLIYSELKQGNKVQLSGFGTFSVAHRASRIGVNPKTREKMLIHSYNTPKFKAGERLKDVVKRRTN